MDAMGVSMANLPSMYCPKKSMKANTPNSWKANPEYFKN